MSNLKQLGLGVMMYVQDYDERYPFSQDYRNGDYYDWKEFTEPYVKSDQVFYCPSSPVGNTFGYRYGNYGANPAVLFTPHSPRATLSMAAVSSPSGTYMIMDAGNYYLDAFHASAPKAGGGQYYYLPGTGPGSPYNRNSSTGPNANQAVQSDFESGRHFGGVNMMFADGHVKWLQSQVVAQEAKLCYQSCIPWPSPRSSLSAWNPSVDH